MESIIYHILFGVAVTLLTLVVPSATIRIAACYSNKRNGYVSDRLPNAITRANPNLYRKHASNAGQMDRIAHESCQAAGGR